MSNRAQPAFRETPGQVPDVQLRFWRVPELGDRALLSAQSPEPASSIAFREVSEMLRHYFHLQEAEGAIAVRARRRGKCSSGTKAMRLLEMERQRIALELHTGVCQMLAAIRLQLEIVGQHLADPPAPVGLAMDRIGELADGAQQQARSVSQRLNPPEWQRLSLPAALQQLWELSGIPQKFAGSLRMEGVLGEPSLQVKVLLYRAAQEALSNLVRHSRASRADGLLELRGDRFVLTITDDGVGFDAAAYQAAPPNVASGMGLRSIRELAQGLGGDLVIHSGPVGTKLEVSVPLLPH